mgnify:FL=1|jgi:predicted RNA binding protein YcfA (HicA-like mRNA interferase family)
MPSINPIPWKVFECILLAAGFHFSRQNGSHRIYTKEGCIRPLVIPAHSKDIAALIIKNNLRTAGISREDYFSFLRDCE